MKTQFSQKGQMFLPIDAAAARITDRLPVGTYTLNVAPSIGWHYNKVDDFTLPSKLYGNTEKNAARILNTFLDRPMSLGALFSGEKGSGKSLMTKVICNNAAKLMIPTIIINSPFRGDEFSKTIQDLEQPAIILFDEFEKTYSDTDNQNAVLTLFDGTFPSRKLFLLTCNDKFQINPFMRNRPGRVHYHLEFTGLDPEFVREYCEDRLEDKSKIDAVVGTSRIFAQFSFDMLQALIEEINRYGEHPAEAVKVLNMKPSYDDGGQFTAIIYYKGKSLNARIHNTVQSPLTNEKVYVNAFAVFPEAVPQEHHNADEFADWLEEHGDDGDDDGTKIETATLKRNKRRVETFVLTRKNMKHFDGEDSFIFSCGPYEIHLVRDRDSHPAYGYSSYL